MGMSGDTALTLAKNYVKKTLQGQGALKGQDGFSPIVTENKDNTKEIYKLDITTKDGTFTTPNLKGFIGADGFSPIATVTKVGNTTTITLTDKNGTTSEMIMDGETNIIESITVNGVAVPISDKTVNIDLSGYVEKEDGKTLVSASDVSQIRKNKDDIATLNGTGDGSVDKKIADKLSEQTYLTKEIATADEVAAYIADPATAKFNVIYLVKDATATGADVYYEYQRIGNEESSTFEMTGDTSTDLSDYAKITDVNTELDKKEKQIIDLKMLGWAVPIECPIQNYVDSDGVFHQRVDRVDLGDLEWIFASEPNRFNAEFKDVKFVDNNTSINAYSNIFTVRSFNGAILFKDKCISAYGVDGVAISLVAINDSYTDATTFKNAMKGVYLYYELATEKTISVDGNECTERINDSLEEQGLLNKFDGDLLVGSVYASSDGSLTTDYTYVCNRNKIYCYENDIVHIRTKNTAQIIALYYNENEYISCEIVNSNQYDFIVPSGTTYMNFDIQDNTLSPSDIHIYINNEIEQIKNDLSVKKFELVAGVLWLCVSGKHCVLTLNGYNLTEPTHFDKLEEYQPYLVARNVVSNGDSVCIAAVEPNGNINASDLVVGTSLTGQLFGEISWITNI